MAGKIVHGKPGPNGSTLLYDEKGHYIGKSSPNAAGNLVYTDVHGSYIGRCKPGPGEHVILIPEQKSK